VYGSLDPWLQSDSNYRITAEEIKDASRVLPLAMVWTLILNGVTGFVMLVTYLFVVGDIQQITANPIIFPFIEVFLNATGSVGGATAMVVVIMVMQLCAAISNVATTSRQMYAFARDGGLPFSKFLSHVCDHVPHPIPWRNDPVTDDTPTG
jgi:amino acid transporter